MRPVDGIFNIRSPRTEDYRHRLLTTFGPYCAYCESPLGSHVPQSFRCSDDRTVAVMRVPSTDDVVAVARGATIPQAHGWDNTALACDACQRARDGQPGTGDQDGRRSPAHRRTCERRTMTLLESRDDGAPLRDTPMSFEYTGVASRPRLTGRRFFGLS